MPDGLRAAETAFVYLCLSKLATVDTTLHLFGPDDEIELASLGIRFPLAILYRGTTVPEMLNGQD